LAQYIFLYYDPIDMEIENWVLEIWLLMNQLNTSGEAVEEHYLKRLVQYSQHLAHSSEWQKMS